MPTTTGAESVRTHVLRSLPHFLVAVAVMLVACFAVRATISKEVVRDHRYMLAHAVADSLSGHAPVDLAATGGPTLDRLVNSPEPDWRPDYRPAGWERFDLARAPTLGLQTVTFDTARQINAVIADSTDPLHAAEPFVLHASASEYGRAVQCLAAAVHYEAASEPVEGQEAVAQVVLNRVRTPGYPKSVCGVVFQGAERSGCQFSFACDGSMNRIPAAWAWKNAQAVATHALNGFVLAKVGDATHYHATYVLPRWSVTLVKLGRIGLHVFYRPTGPAYFAPYAGGELAVAKANYIGKPQLGLSGAPPPAADAPLQLADLTAVLPHDGSRAVIPPSEITVSNVPMVDGKAVMPTVHALISARAAFAKQQQQARLADAAAAPGARPAALPAAVAAPDKAAPKAAAVAVVLASAAP